MFDNKLSPETLLISNASYAQTHTLQSLSVFLYFLVKSPHSECSYYGILLAVSHTSIFLFLINRSSICFYPPKVLSENNIFFCFRHQSNYVDHMKNYIVMSPIFVRQCSHFHRMHIYWLDG